jgi:hypothetical protein
MPREAGTWELELYRQRVEATKRPTKVYSHSPLWVTPGDMYVNCNQIFVACVASAPQPAKRFWFTQ